MTVMYLVMHLQGKNTGKGVPLNSRICNLRNDCIQVRNDLQQGSGDNERLNEVVYTNNSRSTVELTMDQKMMLEKLSIEL